MGKPAARSTDMVKTCNDPVDMPVSQIIAVGTVLINNLPAAKMNDKVVGVDTHIIMVPSPGGPVPTPLPHPYAGQLMLDLSTTVFIQGMPAAMQGSKSMNMPPHIPCGPGPFQKPPSNQGEVMMGSPNVQIGNGGGGGAGAGGSGAKDADAKSKGGTSALKKAKASKPAEEEAEKHFLDVTFTDKGGFPITGAYCAIKDPDGNVSTGALTGKIRRDDVSPGSHEIRVMAVTKAAWSVKEAREGETVKMQVETVGVEDGEEATFTVWKKDLNQPDRKVGEVAAVKVQGGKVEAEWAYHYDAEQEEDQAKRARYSAPKFYFIVSFGQMTSRSAILDYKDWLEIRLHDEEDQPVKNVDYKVFLANGEVRTGKLDGDGYAKIEKVPPGRTRVTFPEEEADSA